MKSVCHPGAFHSCKGVGDVNGSWGWTAFARTCFPNLEAGLEEAFGSLEELIEFMIDEERQELLSLECDSKLCQLVGDISGCG